MEIGWQNDSDLSVLEQMYFYNTQIRAYVL